MVSFAAMALKGKGLIAAAVVLALVSVWGGLGWWGKAAAERDFADYQRAAAETISRELLRHQATQQRQAELAIDASRQFQKGAADVRNKLQPQLDELATLRTLWASRTTDRLRQPAEAGSGALPTTPEPPGGFDGAACTDRPRALVEAAAGIAQDLATCAAEVEKLKGLQRWAAGLRP